MVRYRKLLIVLSVGITAIVMAIFSHQLINWDSKSFQTIYAVSGLEKADENHASSRNISLDEDTQKVQPTVEDKLVTEGTQDTAITSDSITFSGWVGTEFGGSMASEKVVLYSPTLRKRYTTITSSSGDFIFTDLKPSYDYALNVSPKEMFKRYTKFPIKLRSDQEILNIVLEPISVGILTGRIADSYGLPVTGIEATIQSKEIDFWSTNIITNTNGAFSVAEFPKGRFQLMTKGQQSLRATGLKFDPDAGEPVNLTIDLGPYNLRGRIFDESSRIFDGAHVFLNWALHENGVTIRSTRQISADASGEFLFTELGPGDHELVVSASWGDVFGQTTKQSVRQTINVSVDSEAVNIFFGTLSD